MSIKGQRETPFRLLDLPGEIRKEVYRVILCSFGAPKQDSPELRYHRAEHAILAPGITDIVPAPHSVETAILRTNKQVHREAYDVMVKENRFVHVESEGIFLSQLLLEAQIPVVTMDRAHTDQFQGYLIHHQMGTYPPRSDHTGPYLNLMLHGNDWDQFCRMLANIEIVDSTFAKTMKITLRLNPISFAHPWWPDMVGPFFTEKTQQTLLQPIRTHLRGFPNFTITGTVETSLADTVLKEIGRREYSEPIAFINEVESMKKQGTEFFQKEQYENALHDWRMAVKAIDCLCKSSSWEDISTKGRTPFADILVELQFGLLLDTAQCHLQALKLCKDPEDVVILTRGEWASIDLKRAKAAAENYAMHRGRKWKPRNELIAKHYYQHALLWRLMDAEGLEDQAIEFIDYALQHAPEHSKTYLEEKESILKWRKEAREREQVEDIEAGNVGYNEQLVDALRSQILQVSNPSGILSWDAS